MKLCIIFRKSLLALFIWFTTSMDTEAQSQKAIDDVKSSIEHIQSKFFKEATSPHIKKLSDIFSTFKVFLDTYPNSKNIPKLNEQSKFVLDNIDFVANKGSYDSIRDVKPEVEELKKRISALLKEANPPTPKKEEDKKAVEQQAVEDKKKASEVVEEKKKANEAKDAEKQKAEEAKDAEKQKAEEAKDAEKQKAEKQKAEEAKRGDNGWSEIVFPVLMALVICIIVLLVYNEMQKRQVKVTKINSKMENKDGNSPLNPTLFNDTHDVLAQHETALLQKDAEIGKLNEELEKTKQQKDAEIGTLNEELKKVKLLANQQQAQTNVASFVPPSTTTPIGKYFFAEALVTAGPRKNFANNAKDGDYGLGEDVTGFIVLPEKVIFWVLDGTSDSDTLTREVEGLLHTQDKKQEEFFSSRLLAQNIAWNVHKSLQNAPASQNSKALLQQAIYQTEVDWTNKIDQISKTDKATWDYVTKLLKVKRTLQCSTTVVLGILDIHGNLDVCKIGDSKVVTQPELSNLPTSKGRQFAMLKMENTDAIGLLFSPFAGNEVVHCTQQGIKTVFAMTDGISAQMENWLKTLKDVFPNESISKVITQFKQKTEDDKAMCIIQIKG